MRLAMLLALFGLAALLMVGCHRPSGDPYDAAFARTTEVYRAFRAELPMPCTKAQADAAAKTLETNPRISFLKEKALDATNPDSQEAAIWTLYHIKWRELPNLVPAIVSKSTDLLSLTAMGVISQGKSGDPSPAFALSKIIREDQRPLVLSRAIKDSEKLSSHEKEVIAKAVVARIQLEKVKPARDETIISTLKAYSKKTGLKL